MVMNTSREGNYCNDLEDILKSVKKYIIRSNPSKFSFRLYARKFLCFILTRRGIEVNLDKCQTIIRMRSSKTIKEVK